jgi:drug/metabolite transporter (DMT)-like permease
MGWFYLLLVVIGFSTLMLACKVGVQKGCSALGIVIVVHAVAAMAAGTAVLIDGKGISLSAMLLGMAGGVGGGVAFLMYVAAIRIGHYGFSNAIWSASFLVGVAFSLLFLGEAMSLARGAGMAMLLVAIFLITFSSADGTAKASKHWGRWALLIGVGFLLNGAPLACQAVVAKLNAPIMPFMTAAYTAGALALLPLAIGKGMVKWRTLVFGALGAAGSMTGILFNIKAMGSFESGAGIAMPVALSGPMVVAVVLSLTWFKERISAIGYVGIACEVAGVVLLGVSQGAAK